MLLKLISFQLQVLMRTGFFVQQAALAPLAFFMFLYLSALANDFAPQHGLWLHSAIAGLWASTICAMGIISYQRFQGTLEHLAISPLPPATVFSSLCLAATAIGLLGIPISICCEFILLGSVTVTAASLVSLATAYLSCAASAIILTSIFVRSRNAIVFEPLLLTPVWMLTGLVISFTALPGWLQPLALLHPLTGAVNILSAATVQTATLWVLHVVCVCAIYLLASKYLLRRALLAAHRDGTLGLA
ncbi:ABC transporter permease [Canibacter sp. lx-45]|uniref:ABC transporter permease n=1 Tax=Canibacter zhuwentaonis TaxID=2837491 RepID=UPI001BDD8E69|nr:ABC transporter permease [Canibacter zhuwentaonis]MBT1035467.1 ABC transporter permease [Canibacter zhuwentaonis]